MFIDTHCHINMMVDKKPETLLERHHTSSIEHIVAQAYQAGVYKILNVGTSLIETRNAVEIARLHDNVWATAGIHPCDTHAAWYEDFVEIQDLVASREKHKICGIGETGLDFYHKPFNKQRQIDAFKAHIQMAEQTDLALVVHIREAADEALSVLEPYKGKVRGTVHCFMQDRAVAQTVIQWGWMIGIDGPITYPKNEWLREIVADVPLDHLILETDAPFLTPQQKRGERNKPAYLHFIAQMIADLHGVSLEMVAQKTTANAEKLFRLS